MLGTPDQPLYTSWACTQVHRFGQRAFWKPFQRFQPLGGFHCARAGDANHEASGHKSSSCVCGSSACFGAAHWPSYLSRLGSTYCRPLARCGVQPPHSAPPRTTSPTSILQLAADEFLFRQPAPLRIPRHARARCLNTWHTFFSCCLYHYSISIPLAGSGKLGR